MAGVRPREGFEPLTVNGAGREKELAEKSVSDTARMRGTVDIREFGRCVCGGGGGWGS